MERLVCNHIYPIVSTQINSAQHGFIKHRSTTTKVRGFVKLKKFQKSEKNSEVGG